MTSRILLALGASGCSRRRLGTAAQAPDAAAQLRPGGLHHLQGSARHERRKPRKALAIFLADHSARVRGVVIPDGEQGAQLAHLVRGGCTLSPDAYLFTVIDRAIVAEMLEAARSASSGPQVSLIMTCLA